MFKHIRLTTKSSSWHTCINPNMSNEEIEKAFLNKSFDVGSYPAEQMETVQTVDFLTDYIVSFDGRTLGAIGAKHFFNAVSVSAYNKDDARLKLYDKYDSISNLVFQSFNTNIS